MFVLGSAGVFWNPRRIGVDYLIYLAVVAVLVVVFVIGWIWILGASVVEPMKNPRDLLA